jgi:hypothetical protein
MGGVVGNEVYTTGGFIINTLATGNVWEKSDNGSTIGGITGGGGDDTNTDIRGCVALNATLDAGNATGRWARILGQWYGTTSLDGVNFYPSDRAIGTNGVNTATFHINGTGITTASLNSQSPYETMSWVVTGPNAAWGGMGSDGYPKLRWE